MRSGREHWASRVVVEVRQGAGGEEQEERRRGEETRRGDEERRRGEEEEKEEEEQATDIKSNNPHLAGGEKKKAPTSRFSNVFPSSHGESLISPEFKVSKHGGTPKSSLSHGVFGDPERKPPSFAGSMGTRLVFLLRDLDQGSEEFLGDRPHHVLRPHR